MALNIEQATVGYDTAGLQDYINKINLEVIDALTQEMDTTTPKLRETIDSVWVGQSAEAFKTKLEEDTTTVKNTLESIKEMVESEFAQIAANVDTYDQDAAEYIKNFE